jgi:hypothetical protein
MGEHRRQRGVKKQNGTRIRMGERVQRIRMERKSVKSNNGRECKE